METRRLWSGSGSGLDLDLWCSLCRLHQGLIRLWTQRSSKTCAETNRTHGFLNLCTRLHEAQHPEGNSHKKKKKKNQRSPRKLQSLFSNLIKSNKIRKKPQWSFLFGLQTKFQVCAPGLKSVRGVCKHLNACVCSLQKSDYHRPAVAPAGVRLDGQDGPQLSTLPRCSESLTPNSCN